MPDNRPITENAPPGTCPVLMSDKLPCGRPIYLSPPGVEELHVCVMHSTYAAKPHDSFSEEIKAILRVTSKYQRSHNKHDFRYFVFPNATFSEVRFEKCADFRDTTFIRYADFSKATFTQDTKFNGATFAQNANFHAATFQYADFNGVTFNRNADFSRATFTHHAYFRSAAFKQHAVFSKATFKQNTEFRNVTFTQNAYFSSTTFVQGANFRGATITKKGYFDTTWFLEPVDFGYVVFLEPKVVEFRQINQPRKHFDGTEQGTIEPCKVGLRAYFTDCNMEEVTFENVSWHKRNGRMVLQDELDIHTGKRNNYEIVAVAYRRLVNNFERSRQYDLAEDCFIGAMEMKRLDPNQPLSRHIVTTLYKWASLYGSSYTRALGVLFGLLGVFGVLYSLPGFGLTPTSDMAFLEGPYLEGGYSWQQFIDGLLYAFEVITFTREPTFTVTNYLGKAVRILETIFVPAQLALVFLALRRRFRR